MHQYFIGLERAIGNVEPILASCMPGFSFSTEFCPGIRFCSHTALQAAAAQVSYENTDILLHTETNVDLKGGKFGTAL